MLNFTLSQNTLGNRFDFEGLHTSESSSVRITDCRISRRRRRSAACGSYTAGAVIQILGHEPVWPRSEPAAKGMLEVESMAFDFILKAARPEPLKLHEPMCPYNVLAAQPPPAKPAVGCSG